MKRRLMLGMGLMALVTPILYLYLLLAGRGPAEAVMAVLPVTRLLVVVAVASFLLGWVTITTLSFPHSLDVPLRGGITPAWWPGWCLSYDVVAAAYLAALIVIRRTWHAA